MGTVLQFQPRPATRVLRKVSTGSMVGRMSDDELREAHSRITESDYALPAEERLRASIEIEMKLRDILPQSDFPAPRV